MILPLFAVALPTLLLLESRFRQREFALLVIRFMLISDNFRLVNRLAETDFNVLESYVYFGGLGFLVLLLRLRAGAERATLGGGG